MIHVYTGNGKGKTTASLGLAMRAAGQGFKVLVVQFMKSDTTAGEYRFIKKVLKSPVRLNIVQFGKKEFYARDRLARADYDEAAKGISYAEKSCGDGTYDVIILDEINDALDYNLVSMQRVKQFLQDFPSDMELVLTGRNCPPAIIQVADYVTRMEGIKHPYKPGGQPRRGIDF